jgi:hypothetical protein
VQQARQQRPPTPLKFDAAFAQKSILAVAFSGTNARPKAKENSRPDHESDHDYVPQRHGTTNSLRQLGDIRRDPLHNANA